MTEEKMDTSNTFRTMNATVVLSKQGRIIKCNDRDLQQKGEASSTYVKSVLGILFDDSPEVFKKLISEMSPKEYNYTYAKMLLEEYC